MKKTRIKYYVDSGSFFAEAAAILMVLAAVLHFIGSLGQEGDKLFMYLQVILPVAGALLFAALLLLLGKIAFWATALPVLMGTVYIITESLGDMPPLETVLNILLALIAAAVYIMTAFGKIRTKWIGALLYVLLIVYMFLVRDRALLPELANTPANIVLRELALLFALLGMVLTALGMHKRTGDSPLPEGLPKLDPPVVKPPESAPAQAPSAEPEAVSTPVQPEVSAEPAVTTASESDQPETPSLPEEQNTL